MGKGPSIQELAEKEEAFRAYLKQIRKELEADKSAVIQELDTQIKNYYANGGWEYKPFMQLDNVEIQQVSSWSLDNVSKMIGNVSDAIFGVGEPPAGVEVEVPENMAKSIGSMANLELLIVAKVFQAVQGILESFATESSFRGKSITKTVIIAPGMTTFIAIKSDVWKNKGFFNNDSIGQYLFIVRSFFSLEQAGDISKYNDLLAYEELKAAYRLRISSLAKRIGDIETPYSALTELEEELGHYDETLTKITAMIEKLHKKEVGDALLLAQQARKKRDQMILAKVSLLDSSN